MILLTKEQAEIVLAKARDEMAVFGSLSLGRALSNCLNLKQVSNILQPERDFFFIKDEYKVLELFNKHCVEEGKDEV